MTQTATGSSMPTAAGTLGPPSALKLPPVFVRADREIRTIVGLRPYRRSGFVVRAERLGETLIVHNYGHGGGGITLAWGTARLAVDLGAPGHVGAVAVLGCGIVGLSTARLLQEAGFAVTIYSKALPQETTSHVAGGQWFPFNVCEPEFRSARYNAQFLAAAEFAYTRYQSMLGPRFGVRTMRNYFPAEEPFDERDYLGCESVLRPMMLNLRDLSPEEYCFPAARYMRQFDTMLIEPPIYLAALLEEFYRSGGKLAVREIPDRAAIQALPERLVFNCTGLGSRDLFDDAELIPMKGQITILEAQLEVDYAVCTEETYMFSRKDGIVLGGTHDKGIWSTVPDTAKKDEILSRHAAFFNNFRAEMAAG